MHKLFDRLLRVYQFWTKYNLKLKPFTRQLNSFVSTSVLVWYGPNNVLIGLQSQLQIFALEITYFSRVYRRAQTNEIFVLNLLTFNSKAIFGF